jgi:hypothetical protein
MKLAAIESLVNEPKAAARELQTVIEKLVHETGPAGRTDALLQKADASGLSAEEKLELQALLSEHKGAGTGVRNP